MVAAWNRRLEALSTLEGAQNRGAGAAELRERGQMVHLGVGSEQFLRTNYLKDIARLFEYELSVGLEAKIDAVAVEVERLDRKTLFSGQTWVEPTR